MNTKKNSVGHSSIVQAILMETAGRKSARQFLQSSLSRLIESAFFNLLDTGHPGEMFLHIPESMIEDISANVKLSEPPDSGKLYVCQADSEKVGVISLTSVGTLPEEHPLQDELLVFMVGTPVAALICAQKVIDDMAECGNQNLWTGLINFSPVEVVTIINFIGEKLQEEIKKSKIKKNLDRISELLINGSKQTSESQIWGKFLIDFASNSDQYYRAREGKLESARFLSRFQEAVGWELDIDGLFKSMASVLKDSLGYDYLELITVKKDKDKWKRDEVMKRNDTEHGGELLTLILKPEMLNSVLEQKKPVLLNQSPDSSKYFANPRLIPFMSLKSGVLIPLIYSDSPNGLVKMLSSSPNHFTERDLNRMETIGRILAKSVKNLQTHTSLQRMATIDGLTNVFNRRFFTEQVNREFERARRYDSSLSLIMIDIDHFKHYNDTNGHLAGDKVLSQVAAILKKSVRGADVVARYGGEEFVVILPETGLANGTIVAEKVRSAVESTHFKNQVAQPNGNLTISLGMASLTQTVENATELINMADMALYEAKKQGRNRCRVYNSA